MKMPAIKVSAWHYKYPLLDLSLYSAVINVSDSPCGVFTSSIPYFWFPIHETSEWGYSPFYGAAKVVDQFREASKPILLHCHGGVNRSPSVAYAVLRSDGCSDDLIESYYFNNNLKEAFFKAMGQGCIPTDVIEMLSARHKNKTYSIAGLLVDIKSKNCFHPNFKPRKKV